MDGERAINASLTIAQTFDDNVFDDDENRESGLVTNIIPGYRMYLPLNYLAFELVGEIPTFLHWDREEDNETLWDVKGTISTATWHGLGLTISDHLKPMDIEFTGTFLQNSNKNKVQSNVLQISPYFGFPITSRSRMQIRYTFSMGHYFQERYGRNYMGHNASLQSATQITARLTFSAGYSFSHRLLFDQDLQTNTHLILLGITGTWSRVVIGLHGGVHYTTYSGRDSTNDDPSFGEYIQVSFKWLATQWLNIELSYRRYLAEDINSNTTFNQDVGIEFQLPITSWFTIDLGTFLRDYRYVSDPEGNDLVFGGMTQLNFQLMENLMLFAGYTYTQNVGNEQDNDFSNHFISLGLNYSF